MFKIAQGIQGFFGNLKQTFMGSAETVEHSLGYDDPMAEIEIKPAVSAAPRQESDSVGQQQRVKPQYIPGVSKVLEIKSNDEKLIGEAPYLGELGMAAIRNAENLHKPIKGNFPPVNSPDLFI